MTDILTPDTLAPRERLTFYFIGVTTGKSSILNIFPRWMDILEEDAGIQTAELAGLDVPLGAPPEVYRKIVQHIKDDPNVVGGLVTTHKLDLVAATRDLFDGFDTYGEMLGEASAISKKPLTPQPPLPEGEGMGVRVLYGHALDPISSGRSIEAFLPLGQWVEGAEVLCFGCGGAAVATTIYLAGRPDRPRRVTLTDISESRLAHARDIHQKMQHDIEFEYILNADAAENDRLIAALPRGSLVINATGMGKDRPGSPITDSGVFPQDGYAWEYNYRGELTFLHQAKRQGAARNLHVEDGWTYFVHGWTLVVAAVFEVDLTPPLFAKLDKAART